MRALVARVDQCTNRFSHRDESLQVSRLGKTPGDVNAVIVQEGPGSAGRGEVIVALARSEEGRLVKSQVTITPVEGVSHRQ
jgi:hypothetical protein